MPYRSPYRPSESDLERTQRTRHLSRDQAYRWHIIHNMPVSSWPKGLKEWAWPIFQKGHNGEIHRDLLTAFVKGQDVSAIAREYIEAHNLKI